MSDPRYAVEAVVLTTRGLTKRYGKRVVVDDLSIEVAAGDVYGFLGPNGAGKSTSMRMLVGLVHPTAGEVRVLGERVGPRHRAALRRVGAIVEAPSFYGYLTGRDNLRMLADLTGACAPARIDEVLERVALADRARDPVRVYSHGMKQRLAIAAALLPKPELVLLDEPTNGLDPVGIRDMRALIRSLAADDGLTVFLSSHLLVEVEQVCNRGAILARGKKQWEGEVASLLEGRRQIRMIVEPVDRAARVMSEKFSAELHVGESDAWLAADGIESADVVDALVAAGIRVREISVTAPTLEDVFVEMVEAS